MPKSMLLLGLTLALPIGLVVSATRTTGRLPPPAAKDSPSKITHVTVYSNMCVVTREVDVPAGTGTFELVSAHCRDAADSSLYSEGNDGTRILSTRYRQRPIREDTREEVRKLEDDLRKLVLSARSWKRTCRRPCRHDDVDEARENSPPRPRSRRTSRPEQ